MENPKKRHMMFAFKIFIIAFWRLQKASNEPEEKNHQICLQPKI
jgi:hypothetical protein